MVTLSIDPPEGFMITFGHHSIVYTDHKYLGPHFATFTKLHGSLPTFFLTPIRFKKNHI